MAMPVTPRRSRTVTVNADTRYINVTRLETVAPEVGDKTVNWTFDTLGNEQLPLSKVVPNDKVTVYLEESPLYRSGS